MNSENARFSSFGRITRELDWVYPALPMYEGSRYRVSAGCSVMITKRAVDTNPESIVEHLGYHPREFMHMGT